MPENEVPVSGHGAILSVTLDPVGAPSTFTRISRIEGNLPPANAPRVVTKFTTHDRGIDEAVLGPAAHADWQFKLKYVGDDPTHPYLYQTYLDGTLTNFLWEFDSGVGSEGGIMAYGYVSVFDFAHESGAGTRDANVTIVKSGPYWVDGVLIGDSFP